MYEYKKCVPHAVLPHVEVCPERLASALATTEFIQREYQHVESFRVVLGAHHDRGAETMLALL